MVFDGCYGQGTTADNALVVYMAVQGSMSRDPAAKGVRGCSDVCVYASIILRVPVTASRSVAVIMDNSILDLLKQCMLTRDHQC